MSWNWFNHNSQRMKKLLIIIDGMDDEPIPVLGNLTPSHFAYMPALGHMREKGNVYWQRTVPSGNVPGTEVAVLNILGCDVPAGFSSRSWLEALGSGIEVEESDLCLRCNLISHSDGLLTSHCGGDVTSGQCYEIIDILNDRFGGKELEFIGSGNFRNLLIVHGTNASVRAEAPHTLLGKDISHLIVQSDDSVLGDRLNNCIIESRTILKNYPANGISLWSPGCPASTVKRRIDGALIAGVNIMKGIGKVLGLSVIEVDGATGDEHTDYNAKLQAAMKALETYDFVVLHIEATDEVSHRRDSMKKVQVLEGIDRELLAPLLKKKINLDVTVQSDHATSSLTGMHLDCPVEVINYSMGIRDEK